MARIIESSGRRIIKMSVDDIISIVQDYQRIVPRACKLSQRYGDIYSRGGVNELEEV